MRLLPSRRVSQRARQARADLLSKAIGSMDPEFLANTADANPDFVLGMLGSLQTPALTDAVCRHPEPFIRLIRTMPREVLRRLLDENRAVICEMVLRLDTDLLLQMMGLDQPALRREQHPRGDRRRLGGR